MKSFLHVFFIMLPLLLSSAPSHADRIKDLAKIAGVRDNQLIGYGIVVGLDGTGDQTTQTPFTIQSLENMLRQLGINLPPGTNPQLNNIAAVVVNATLPPFSNRDRQLTSLSLQSVMPRVYVVAVY